MSQPSYTYYKDTYGGKLSQVQYLSQLNDATAHVDWLIGWKVVPLEYQSAYWNAICSCVDVFQQYGRTPMGGFSIGTFRVNDSAGKVSGKDIATDAAWEYLAPTGLLWAGVD